MTKRDRRALVIGAAIIVVWLGGVRGVPGAVRALSTVEERTEVKARLLEGLVLILLAVIAVWAGVEIALGSRRDPNARSKTDHP